MTPDKVKAMFLRFKAKRSDRNYCPLFEVRRIGKAVHEMLEGAEYGDSKMDTLVAGSGQSSSALYAFSNFFENYTQEETEKLSEWGIAWRAAKAAGRIKNHARRMKLFKSRPAMMEADFMRMISDVVKEQYARELALYRRGRGPRPDGRGLTSTGRGRGPGQKPKIKKMRRGAVVRELHELAQHAAGFGVIDSPDLGRTVARVIELVAGASHLLSEERLLKLQSEGRYIFRQLSVEGADVGGVVRAYIAAVQKGVAA